MGISASKNGARTYQVAVKRVQTPRLMLEPLMAFHAAEMFEVLNDPAIYEFENEPPSSIERLSQRYQALENRLSPDQSQRWLNWVVRLNGQTLCGYVQASVFQSGTALIAYELNSKYWRQGFGREAVEAMLEELRTEYSVVLFVAVLKTANFRSMALLNRLKFQSATRSHAALFAPQSDERVVVRTARRPGDAS